MPDASPSEVLHRDVRHLAGADDRHLPAGQTAEGLARQSGPSATNASGAAPSEVSAHAAPGPGGRVEQPRSAGPAASSAFALRSASRTWA